MPRISSTRKKFWKFFYFLSEQQHVVRLHAPDAIGASTESVKRRILYIGNSGEMRASDFRRNNSCRKCDSQSSVSHERDNQYELRGAVGRCDGARAAALTKVDSCTVPLDRSQSLDRRLSFAANPQAYPPCRRFARNHLDDLISGMAPAQNMPLSANECHSLQPFPPDSSEVRRRSLPTRCLRPAN